MSIVEFRNQSGALYAYDYTSETDPDTGKAHQVRKYLGRVDEETGEIIKTTGKRGRRPKATGSAPSRKKKTADDASVESLQKQIDQLQEEVDELKHQNLEMQKLLKQIAADLHLETIY